MSTRHKKVQWIFFDLDGTLADSIPAMYQVYFNFLNKFDIKGTKEEFEELNGPSLPEIISVLKTRYSLPNGENTLVEHYKKNILDAYKNHVKPLGDSNHILQELEGKGYKLLLVTSANQEVAIEFIKRQKWNHYFQHCVFGGEIKRAKPDPEIYRLALKKANISSSSAVVIEDSCNGIKSAKSASVFTVGLANNQSKKELLEAGADIVISQLKEILPVMEAKP